MYQRLLTNQNQVMLLHSCILKNMCLYIPALTSLVGCDGDRGGLIGSGVLRRHAVDRPHLEGVVGVRLQLVDGDTRVPQAELLRRVMYADAARLAPLSVRSAPFTHHVVRKILSPA